MKRHFLSFIITSAVLLFFLSSQAQAQIPPQLGLNCGDPNSTTINKCCYYDIGDATNFDPPVPEFAKGLVKSFTDRATAPLRGFREMQKKVKVEPCMTGSVPRKQGDPNRQVDASEPGCVCTPVAEAEQYSCSKTGDACKAGSVPRQKGDLNSWADQTDPNCMCVPQVSATEYLCERIGDSDRKIGLDERKKCLECVRGKGDAVNMWTSIGCVPTSLGAFIQQTLLGWSLGVAGLSALLCIIYAAFLMQTSSGNPEKTKKAQELITSCIVGLLLIIFSVYILKLIGVDILRLPGFGK